MLGFVIRYKISKILILFIGNLIVFCDDFKHGIGNLSVVTTEFHKSKQQQGFLFRGDLSVQVRTDVINGIFDVCVERQFIKITHVSVQIEVHIDIFDTKMTSQIV